MKLGCVLCLLTSALALSQEKSDVTLMIDLENSTWYTLDPAESAKWAVSAAQAPVPTGFVYTFKTNVVLADIVSINDQPAKGTFAAWGIWAGFGPTLRPTAPTADISRSQMWTMLFEVHDSERGQVSTLAATGFASGPPPPGTAPGARAGNFVVTGGSGAWAGARGHAASMAVAGTRFALGVEDPAYRRVNAAAGKWRIAVTLSSVACPEVAAAYHSDFSPVSASNPARAGESLVLAVKRLGPTNPGLAPGKAFDGQPLAVVTSPVAVTVNGLPAIVSNQIGWPGTTDTYRVDVTLPGGIVPGTARLSVSAAWIEGPETKIPVQ